MTHLTNALLVGTFAVALAGCGGAAVATSSPAATENAAGSGYPVQRIDVPLPDYSLAAVPTQAPLPEFQPTPEAIGPPHRLANCTPGLLTPNGPYVFCLFDGS